MLGGLCYHKPDTSTPHPMPPAPSCSSPGKGWEAVGTKCVITETTQQAMWIHTHIYIYIYIYMTPAWDPKQC